MMQTKHRYRYDLLPKTPLMLPLKYNNSCLCVAKGTDMSTTYHRERASRMGIQSSVVSVVMELSLNIAK